MLRQFTVNNFKSLINVTYEPGAVNLLVGTNNSGKTNLCQALRFLGQAAREQGTLFDAWQDVKGSGKNVYFDHPTIDLSCTCELAVDDELLKLHYSFSLRAIPPGPFAIDTEQLQISGGSFGSGGVILLKNENGRGRWLNEDRYLQNEPLDTCYLGRSIEISLALYVRAKWKCQIFDRSSLTSC